MTTAEPRIDATAVRGRAGETSIEVWSFAAEAGMRGSSVDELAGGLDDETRVSWVDATGSSPEAFKAISTRLGLTQNGSRSRRSATPRPRLEPFKDHAHATIVIPTLRQRRLDLDEVDVIITDRFLLFGHVQPLRFRDQIEERAAQHPNVIAEDSAFLLFILLDEWLHDVERITEEMDELIEDMEERAIRDSSDTFLDDVIDLKELGFDLYQAVDRHHTIFDAMLNPDFPFVAGEMVENHYRDLSRRFERRVTALHDAREAINNAIDIFSSSTAHRTNKIITLLTIISTVLMPMTAIFAFFGINFVDLPLFTTRMFIVMWAAVAVTTVPIIAMLARRGWLRQI